MRAVSACILVVSAALLAGCAGSEVAPTEETDPGPTPPPAAARDPVLLLDEGFRATPAAAASFPVAMPGNATNVTVRLRVDAAAGTILDVDLEGCGARSFTVNVVVQPVALEAVLCPAAAPGAHELRVGGEGGLFAGHVTLEALAPAS